MVMVVSMAELLPKNVKDKLETLIAQTGIAYDENVVMSNLVITGVPQDDFITSSFVRRAKAIASDIPETYRCEACGRKYNDRNEFVACMQDHIKDFMAGLPIDILPEYVEEKMSRFPAEIRREFEERKKAGISVFSNMEPEEEE